MKKVILVCGPTASGKTKLSVELAKHFGFEIINGDSVQALRGLEIGSAKIKEEEKEDIKHYLLDILEPNQKYSVCDFQRDARKIINNSEEIKIICGGTGLYIKACVCNYEFSESQRDQNFEKSYQHFTNEELYNLLRERDFEASLILHPNNRRRVLRALEIIKEGISLKSEKNKKNEFLYDVCILLLMPDRKKLYEKIDQRVDEMFQKGLEKEVSDLYEKNLLIDAIGYKEFYPYFKGEITSEEVRAMIKKNTRNFAKRQLTFFKNQLPMSLIDVDYENFDQAIESAINLVEEFLKK